MTATNETQRVLPLEALAGMSLAHGAHPDRSNGLCSLEVVAWLAGEPHSDTPECVCPVIAAFLRRWNDGLPDDATRDRLLKPLLPLVLTTRSTSRVERRRAWLATDWLVRTHAPAWLDLVDGIKPHGQALRDLPPLTDAGTARKAQGRIAAAWAAAGDAAWAAAWAAAGAAAWDAAGAAAGAAARAAAGAAAWDAAWAAAGAAAWAAAGAAAGAAARDAAGAAAWAAAGAAAGAALRPTTEQLQASAQELVRAMCAVGAEGGSER